MTIQNSIPAGFGDSEQVAVTNPRAGSPELVTQARVDTLAKFDHFYTLTPVCRIHVYTKNQGKPYGDPGKLPQHWCTYATKGSSFEGSTNQPECVIGKDGKYIGTDIPMEWQVLDARVNSTRQWQSSSAIFQIARPLDATTPAAAPPIRPNDVIVIEMGYCNGVDSNVSLPNGQTNLEAFVGDVVFYGIVDTVKERGGSGDKDGIVVSVMARDPMSILTDNKLRGHYNPLSLLGYNRAFIIRDLIWRGGAINYVKWTTNPDKSYARDSNGFRIPLRAPGTGNQVQPESFNDANCYLNIGTLELSERNFIKPPDVGNATGILLTDKFPLDVIRHFSLVETAPRELWADRRTGEVHWQFRRTDMRRLLTDPNSRQYFYRFPANRANIISYTMEWSTAGTITHFTIQSPTASSQNGGTNSEMYAESPTALLTDPHRTGVNNQNLLRPLTRNRFIYDDTLLSESDSPVVAGAMIDIWGRSIETGMIMVPGDPSLEIGEAVQIFNTGLFGKRFHEDTQDTNTLNSPGYPEGVNRIEAVTHLFAIGGTQQGFRSVFVMGPIDDDTGDPKRLITATSDLASVKKINIGDLADNGNIEPPNP